MPETEPAPSIFEIVEDPTPEQKLVLDKQAILNLMAEGSTLTQASKEIGVTRATVWNWRQADADFDKAYESAHKAMAEAIADDALTCVKELATGEDKPSKEAVMAANAYSPRASWYASKLLPKLYGDTPNKT